MSNNLQDLVTRYHTKGILVDANLLLLLFIGSYDPHRINKFKRTQERTFKDFKLLVDFLSNFRTIATTPSILTEVSNLSNQLPEHIREAYFLVFRQLASSFDESYKPSKDLCGLPQFSHFGLTDSGIIDLASETYLVLTDDFRLSGFLQKTGVDVINFEHLKMLLP